jgi:hypothetical protein
MKKIRSANSKKACYKENTNFETFFFDEKRSNHRGSIHCTIDLSGKKKLNIIIQI